jgi:cysteine desulfurase
MLRDTLARGIVTRIPEAVINGETDHALPHILNISIPDINGEYTVLALDRAGIAISTKSACKEGKTAASHVVASLGGAQWRACNTLRFSLGRGNTSYDIDRTIQALVDTVHCQHAERKKQS